jgi:hypothetical protein
LRTLFLEESTITRSEAVGNKHNDLARYC